MRRFRAVAVVFTMAMVAAFTQSPPVAAAVPDAEVHVDSQAYEGQYHTLRVGLRGKCGPGFAFSELSVVFKQDFTAPPVFAAPFACDGKWHRQQISSHEGFHPGAAKAIARLRVTKTSTGLPGADAVHNTAIFIRPGAETLIPATAVLQQNKAVKIVLRARCDAPWVLAGFYLEANQDEFPNQAHSEASTDTYPPVCDGTYYSKTFVLQGGPSSFHKGWLRVDTAIHTLDSVNFDPAPSDTSTRMVKVQ